MVNGSIMTITNPTDAFPTDSFPDADGNSTTTDAKGNTITVDADGNVVESAEEKKKKITKLIFIGIGLLVVGYFAYMMLKKKGKR